MGFFDDLGKKVSDAGQKTVQKTKDMSEIMRINSLVSQTENRLNTTYAQIGRLYVNQHSTDFEEGFASLMASVKNMEAELQGYREQIQDLKGIRSCPQCGAEVQKGGAFCTACGYAMPKPEVQPVAEDGVVCAKCGNIVKATARFCTSCGQPISPAAVPPQPTVAPQPAVAPEPVTMEQMQTAPIYDEVQTVVVEPEGKVCLTCGKISSNEATFCTECGTEL